jgi:hypothetical protein
MVFLNLEIVQSGGGRSRHSRGSAFTSASKPRNSGGAIIWVVRPQAADRIAVVNDGSRYRQKDLPKA